MTHHEPLELDIAQRDEWSLSDGYDRDVPITDPPPPSIYVRRAGEFVGERGPDRYSVVPGTDHVQKIRGGSNTRNRYARDTRIVFRGGPAFPNEHYYMIDGDRTGITSVTGLLHLAFEPFEKKKYMIARSCSRTKNTSSQYYGKTVAEVLRMWDVNRDTGSAKHAAIDDFLQGRHARLHREGVGHHVRHPPRGLYAFLRRHPTFEVVRTEWSIFCEESLLAGQLDALFYCTLQMTHVVVDWKNVEKFTVKGSTKGILPMTSDMPDCNLSQYTLQLNLYRYIIEKHYGLKVGIMIVANMRPSWSHECDEYVVWPMDVTPLIAMMPVTEEGRRRLADEPKSEDW